MPATAVVTGVDQGIGRAIARRLRQRLPPGSVVHEAATGDVRDDAAATALAAATAGAADAATADGGGVDIVIIHTTGDVVPGVRMVDQVRDYIAVHNQSVYRLLTAFTPVLRDGGRVVVVSGELGSLDHLPQRLRDRFDGPEVDLPHLSRVMDAYVTAVEAGTAADEGWPAWIEVAARVGQVAAVRALARQIARGAVADPRLGLLVNAVAPGPTDPVEDILRIATLPAGTREPHGELIVGRAPVAFSRTPAHSVNGR